MIFLYPISEKKRLYTFLYVSIYQCFDMMNRLENVMLFSLKMVSKGLAKNGHFIAIRMKHNNSSLMKWSLN
jgi:hypothetical protein